MFGYILVKEQEYLDKITEGMTAQILLDAKRKEYDDLWSKYHAHLTRKRRDKNGVLRQRSGEYESKV